MDIKTLIAEVQKNPPIWDKTLKTYSSRNIVDARWRKISSTMGIDGAVLRKKWKYLRDQFSVECSKIKISKSGDAALTVTEPRWPYFKELLFLKDVIKPRAIKTKEDEPEDDDIDEEQEPYMFIGTNPARKAMATETQPAELKQHISPYLNRLKKRRSMMTTDILHNRRILQLEQEKINTLKSIFQQRESGNDDSLFFESLLPFVSKIPMEKKLQFRNRIQEVVEEFLQDRKQEVD